MWKRFWIIFFEYVFIRIMLRCTGKYVLTIVEYRCEFNDDGSYSYGWETLPVEEIIFNTYVEAMDAFNHRFHKMDSPPPPLHSLKLEYTHWRKGRKGITSFKR